MSETKLRAPNIMDRLPELKVDNRTEYSVSTANNYQINHVVYKDRDNPYLIFCNDKWISINYADLMEIVSLIEAIEDEKRNNNA